MIEHTNSAKLNKEVRIWGVSLYLSVFIGWLIPFFNIIAPLIIWTLKKEDHPYLNSQGKDVINFQITMTLLFLGLALFTLSGVFLPLFSLYIFYALFIAAILGLVVTDVVCTLIGTIKAADGKYYKLPFTINFLK